MSVPSLQEFDSRLASASEKSATIAPPVEYANGHSTKKHLRGSSLLLVGRVMAVAINFAVQVLIVRYLSVSEFGAFGFGLTTVALLSKAAELGLGKGLSRNMSIYHEQKDYGQLFGALILGLGTVFGLGCLLALSVIALRGVLADRMALNPLAMNVLMVLVLLTPLQALEDVLEKTFAVFARARAVFFRRHLLGPLLKLIAALLLVWLHGNVFLLAGAYLAASVLGTVVSLFLLVQMLYEQDLMSCFQLREVRIPAREVFSFSIPLISTDLAFLFRVAMVSFLLEWFRGNTAVAAYRAVFPVARLNISVFDSFKTLFLPWASRLYARGAHAEINELYWKNASWLAVLSFPVFLATFSLSLPTTTLLFGARYADSAPVLAVLSLGCFINAVFGCSTLMLRVYGKVRPIVAIDLATAMAALGLSLALIPRYGAMGGAIAASCSLILQTALHQALLVKNGEMRMLDMRFARVMGTMLIATALLFLIQIVLRPSPIAIAILVMIASAAVIGLNFRQLDIEETFPELRRFPAAAYLLGASHGKP